MSKRCTACGETLPLDRFGVRKSRPCGHTSECKRCLARWQRERRVAKGEEVREYDRQRYLVDGAERRRRLYRRNPEKGAALSRAWRARNPDKVETLDAKRRAQRGRKAPWCTWGEILDVYAQARRLSQATGIDFQVDHIYAINGPGVCGLTCPANLRPLPAGLNAAKRNLLPGFLADELWDPAAENVYYGNNCQGDAA